MEPITNDSLPVDGAENGCVQGEVGQGVWGRRQPLWHSLAGAPATSADASGALLPRSGLLLTAKTLVLAEVSRLNTRKILLLLLVGKVAASKLHTGKILLLVVVVAQETVAFRLHTRRLPSCCWCCRFEGGSGGGGRRKNASGIGGSEGW